MNDCEPTLSSSFSDYVPFVPRIRLQCIVHSPRSPDTRTPANHILVIFTFCFLFKNIMS